MRKRGLCCRPVSVRLSVMFVYCIQTAEDIVKLLSRPDIPIILVVLNSKRRLQFQWNPFIEGVKYTGWEKYAILTEIAVYLGKVRDRPIKLSQMADRSVWVPMILRGTLKGGTRGVIFFRRILTLIPFDLERPNSAG